MKPLPLEIVERELILDGTPTRWTEAANWPFPGPNFWDERPCACGSVRFLVTSYAREEAGEDGGTVRIMDSRIVCGACISFLPGECIVGEVDYHSKIAYIYDSPKNTPKNGRAKASAYSFTLSEMNAYIPDNAEWPGIAWLDGARYLPAPIQAPTPPMIAFKKGKGPRRPRKSSGPTLEGM
jgi:hypothetical protein